MLASRPRRLVSNSIFSQARQNVEDLVCFDICWHQHAILIQAIRGLLGCGPRQIALWLLLVSLFTPLRCVHGGMLVLYGSQTGTAEDVAVGICRAVACVGQVPRCQPMDKYDVRELPNETLVVCVASTTGDGEAPWSMRSFWATLRRRDLPAGALHKVQYAVFGCGDSSYPKFNAVARRLDTRLRQLGALQVVPCGLGDDQAASGVDAALRTWLPALLQSLSIPLPVDGGKTPNIPGYLSNAGGVASLRVFFADSAAAPGLPARKAVAAVRVIASTHHLVLFSQVLST